jgi:hypothetical protein
MEIQKPTTRFVVGGIVYSYGTSLLLQVEQGRTLCRSLLGQAGQPVLPEVSLNCQQAEDYGSLISASVPIGAGMVGCRIHVRHRWKLRKSGE